MSLDIEKFVKNLVDYIDREDFLAAINGGAWIIVFHNDRTSYIYRNYMRVGDTFGSIYYDSFAEVVEVDEYNKIIWVEKCKSPFED